MARDKFNRSCPPDARKEALRREKSGEGPRSRAMSAARIAAAGLREGKYMRLHLLAIAVILSPIAAAAAPTGPEIGLRVGYTVPFGDVAGDGTGGSLAMKDSFSGGVPLQIDLGYRFTPAVSAGVYGGYGFLIPTNCPDTSECSGHNFRLGIGLQFHLAPEAGLDPWIGVGAGYEWLNLKVSSQGQSQDLDVRGFEFGHVDLGADFAVAPGFKFGPFASFSIGQYDKASTGGALGSASGDVAEKKMH